MTQYKGFLIQVDGEGDCGFTVRLSNKERGQSIEYHTHDGYFEALSDAKGQIDHILGETDRNDKVKTAMGGWGFFGF